MSVGTLKGDQTVAFGHRHHRETAALAFACAVGQEVAQVHAGLFETDALCCRLPYTGRDRRAFRAPRLFAPSQRLAARPWKGRAVTECDRTVSWIPAPR